MGLIKLRSDLEALREKIKHLDGLAPPTDHDISVSELDNGPGELKPRAHHIGKRSEFSRSPVLDLRGLVLSPPVPFIRTTENQCVTVFQQDRCVLIAREFHGAGRSKRTYGGVVQFRR